MKRFLYILIILLSACTNHEKDNQIIITGKITGEIPEKIEYTLPIDNINYFGFKNSVIPDSLGNFKIELPIEKTSFIEFFNVYDSYGVIVAEPSMNYSVFINTQDKDNRFHVKSENDQGQNLFNHISKNSILRGSGHFMSEGDKHLKDSIPARIKEDIKKKIEDDITNFTELLNSNLISEEFYKLASADITYYYAGAQTSVALANYIYNETGRPISLNKEEYETLWKESFETYPISNPDLTRSTWFFFYIQSYLGYKNLVEDYNYDNTNETVKQEKTHSDVINIAKKYLTGKQLEYYYAAYLYDTAIYKNYEKELITLFKQFKEDYPSSKYTSFVESEIIPIIAFHKKQNETLNENIHFVENAGNINTLKEAIKNLNTNKVYVDVWATWCSPCKDEFKYNKELYELLKTKNITMLYLSVDKDNKHEAWKDMIKYYELEGYHIRINEKFYNELMDIRGRENAFYIPWHFTTDGEGKIIDINASGPSDILKLKKQLSS